MRICITGYYTSSVVRDGYKWGDIYSLKESLGVTKISDDHCIAVNHRYALTIKLHGITQGHSRVWSYGQAVKQML